MAPRALRHKQRNYYFCILQSRNDCGHSGFAFSREGVVTGSGICFANRSAAQKSHWGFHALRALPSFLVLFWRAKENLAPLQVLLQLQPVILLKILQLLHQPLRPRCGVWVVLLGFDAVHHAHAAALGAAALAGGGFGIWKLAKYLRDKKRGYVK